MRLGAKRLGALFVAVCMTVIAGAAGALAYFAYGFTAADASVVAIAVLSALALYNAVSTRINVRTVVGPQLTELSRGGADLARQVAELGRRLAVAESRMERSLATGEAATEPLAVEIGELGALLDQLAETVASHETRLTEIARSKPRRSEPERSESEPAKPEGAKPEGAKPEGAKSAAGTAAPVASAPAAAEASAGREMLAAIRSAIAANRIDLYLQPIVTLPRRKVRFYEAMSRLRTEGGELLSAAGFIPQAEAGGLMPKIDNLVVFRCVQVLRRLLLKNRDVGVFCNLSTATLTDAVVFPQLLEFLDANRALASSLVLEFTQRGLRGAGPIGSESLAALRACGFHFSLDNVTDLRLEPRELASRGFRYVKLKASLILNRGGIAADIRPGDLPDLLARFGIDLIAEKIESEGTVVDLLDYDVKFGQGFLFSPPRPVRSEALQSAAERDDAVARERAAAADPSTARSPPATLTIPT
jgi:cyclic-di-GMP phosphodiesterase TipF (flagellum assembly factor)